MQSKWRKESAASIVSRAAQCNIPNPVIPRWWVLPELRKFQASCPPKNQRMDYFRSMAAGQGPRLAVIEDIDYPNCIAGWWGEVHVAVHKGLGQVGAITNGVMRDLDVMDAGFPVLAGSIGPSHGFVHVVEIGGPVSLMGMHISQDELMHADRHGAIVIPNEIIADLKQAIETVIANEAIVLGPARAPGFDIERLEKVWAEFEAART
jgi:regulator of RNase E activity RraA